MNHALYFGSFNPVHYGHLSIVKYLSELDKIEKITIIPSPHNPLKDTETLADARQRLEAAREAFKSSKVQVSDIEFHLAEPLFTINTLRELKKLNPNDNLMLVIGADNIANIERWHLWETILEEFEVIVYPRNGIDGASLCEHYNSLLRTKGIHFLAEAPLLNVSSTEIRAKQ